MYRAIEDAYEFTAAAIIAALEKDKAIVDAAFFVLVFGQLERRISELATRRLPREDQRAAMREQAFERHLSFALPDAADDPVRGKTLRWYEQRNRVAHGEQIAEDHNIPAVIQRARDLERLLTAQRPSAAR